MANLLADVIGAQLQQLVEVESEVDGTACLLRVEIPGAGATRHVAGPVAPGRELAEVTSPFRTASITKSFTGLVIAQLISEGRLAADDLMTRHLPSEILDVVPKVHIIDGKSYGEQITVRQLLTHSSGLFDYAQSAGFIGEIITDPSRVWTPREMLEGAAIWGTPHFPPGGGYGYAYSDTGYVLLGLIIENLDGCSLHESYRARILEPLKMSATYLEGHERHRGSPLTHTFEGEHDTSVIHGTADWAGGGLVSDLDDLSSFAQALVAPGLLSDTSLGEFLHWQFRILDPEKHSPGYLGYSFGVEAREIHGLLLRGHRGHWGAWMHVHPETGLTITGTINQANRRPDSIVQSAVRAVIDAGLVKVSA